MSHDPEKHDAHGSHESGGKKPRRFLLLFILLILVGSGWYGYRALSSACPDTDADGLDDCKEQNVYFTDWFNPDSDGDGYLDGQEVHNGYSPHRGGKARLTDVDADHDGLSDWLELQFGTHLNLADSDGDKFSDGMEVQNGYDPRDPKPKKLEKRIEVSIDDQRLRYYLDNIQIGELVVSTGKNDWTPTGSFSIWYKHPRAWSQSSSLWMPYWMAFDGTKFGIHELPEWPDGTKEGEDVLGTPASGGCVRLAAADAEFLYGWAPIGTPVKIY